MKSNQKLIENPLPTEGTQPPNIAISTDTNNKEIRNLLETAAGSTSRSDFNKKMSKWVYEKFDSERIDDVLAMLGKRYYFQGIPQPTRVHSKDLFYWDDTQRKSLIL